MVFGPTGVGKTQLTLHFLNSYFNNQLEIISTDSMQVYQGMDIGTAKPTQTELQSCRHHFIDICSPDESFHAGEFVKQADILISEIYARGNVPLMTGGTGYYFKNFIFGLPEVPKSNIELSKSIGLYIDESAQKRNEKYQLLQKLDPISASKIHINDTYRLSRALECHETNNRPLSSFAQPTRVREGINPIIIGLKRERGELYERIKMRVDSMFDAGLVDEVKALYHLGFKRSDPGMKGIGYREFFEILGDHKEAWDNPTESQLTHIKENIVLNSRHYAKKQITYFKLIPDVNWFHPNNEEGIKQLLDVSLSK